MTEPTRTFWIAVASANHVARGLAGGFMQVCHGKEGPLKRLRVGDDVVYYSPTETFGARDICQAFTAIGTVRETPPYRYDMGGGFVPFRRDVDWAQALVAPIRPLLDHLDFTRGKPNWGHPFRYGLFQISAEDFCTIAQAMAVSPDRRRGLFAA
ncbi:MAG: EVE domain-containing protein [Paracoccaceae bacterium]